MFVYFVEQNLLITPLFGLEFSKENSEVADPLESYRYLPVCYITTSQKYKINWRMFYSTYLPCSYSIVENCNTEAYQAFQVHAKKCTVCGHSIMMTNLLLVDLSGIMSGTETGTSLMHRPLHGTIVANYTYRYYQELIIVDYY